MNCNSFDQAPGNTNYNKATFLYTRIARKWTEAEFEVFLAVLGRSGNARAFEILRSSGGGSDYDLIQKVLCDEAGSFEGYLLEDELEAMRIAAELNQKDLLLLRKLK